MPSCRSPKRPKQVELFALLLDGSDTYDRANRGIISGTRRSNDFHILDGIRLQALQFPGISHLLIVDIYNRCTLAINADGIGTTDIDAR